MLSFLGDLVERVNESGFAGRLDVFEGFENVLQLGGASARWDFEVKFFATTREPRGVTLVDDEVGQSGGNLLGEVDLGGVFS